MFTDNQYVGVKAIAVGWGSISEQKNHSCNLLDVELPVLSNEQCRKTKYEPTMIVDDMLCAGYPEVGAKDTCQVISTIPPIPTIPSHTYHFLLYLRKIR